MKMKKIGRYVVCAFVIYLTVIFIVFSQHLKKFNTFILQYQLPRQQKQSIDIFSKCGNDVSCFMSLKEPLYVNYTIKYDNFNITEPHFLTEEDRKRFLGDLSNVQMLGWQPEEKLRGVVQTIPGGVANSQTDCGFKTKLEEFAPKGTEIPMHDILSPLLVPESNAFQHFIDGVMPKLVQSYRFIKRARAKLLLFKPRDSIIYEILDKLNISKHEVVFHSGTVSAKLQINSCITPPLHPTLWRMARAMYGAPSNLEIPINQSHVVLLTRVGSYNGGRHMVNFEEVQKFLQKRYTSRLKIFEGNYSLESSIQLFGKSAILIGIHGGALYNLNFASSDAHIVEILPMVEFYTPPSGLATRIFWHMAQLLGQTYWRIHQTVENRRSDVVVPLDKLRLMLDKIDAKLRNKFNLQDTK